MATWREIRDLRAAPPDLANSSEARRAVFGASLQQAEELATAAKDVGYATRPILLFYALCQGFRAACAARLKSDWERSGHGLKFAANAGSLLDSVVAPMPGKLDLYSGVMAVSDDIPLPGRVAIGELLASLFEFRDFEIAGQDWARPLILRLPHQDRELSNPEAPAPADDLMVLFDGLKEGLSTEDLKATLAAYPTLDDGEPVAYPTGLQGGIFMGETQRNGVAYRQQIGRHPYFPVFRFPFQGSTVADYLGRFEEIAPGAIEDQTFVRAVQPGVGEGRWLLGSITPWWALLLGLSSLARYHPAQWRAALDIEKEPIASALEHVIDRAEQVIPYYVFQALTAH